MPLYATLQSTGRNDPLAGHSRPGLSLQQPDASSRQRRLQPEQSGETHGKEAGSCLGQPRRPCRRHVTAGPTQFATLHSARRLTTHRARPLDGLSGWTRILWRAASVSSGPGPPSADCPGSHGSNSDREPPRTQTPTPLRRSRWTSNGPPGKTGHCGPISTRGRDCDQPSSDHPTTPGSGRAAVPPTLSVKSYNSPNR